MLPLKYVFFVTGHFLAPVILGHTKFYQNLLVYFHLCRIFISFIFPHRYILILYALHYHLSKDIVGIFDLCLYSSSRGSSENIYGHKAPGIEGRSNVLRVVFFFSRCIRSVNLFFYIW